MNRPPLPIFCCANCGFWQRRFALPATCPVCEDYRHPLPAEGYEFLTPADVAAWQRVTWDEPLPGVWRFTTTPPLGIGSCGYLIETDDGHAHFDGCGWYDDAALDFIDRRGGVRWIAASHPHVYGAWWRVADRFAPRVVVQAEALPLAQAVRASVPFDDSWNLGGGLTLIHTAGHTPDHTVLHDARHRVLFCGDALKFTFPQPGQTVGEPATVSTHKAFDAHLPLTRGDVRRYRDRFEPLDFDAVVTPWEVVTAGGKAAAMRLFDRELSNVSSADPLEL